MRIHNLKFLRALGCDIPHKPEDVNTKELVTKINPPAPMFGFGGLGGLPDTQGGTLWAPETPSGYRTVLPLPPERRIRNPYQGFENPDEVVRRAPCPIHKDGGDCLRIYTNAETGATYFQCVYPACRFYGDPVTLLCNVRKISVTKAIAMLRPGGELAHTLLEPMLDSEAAAYTDSLITQYHVQEYTHKCRNALRDNPRVSRLRDGLSCNTLRFVPPTMGLLVQDPGMPREFKRFLKGKQQSAYTVYPFTYNNVITHIKVQDADSTIAYETATVTRADIGVFPEGIETAPKKLLVTRDPRVAAVLYGNIVTESSGDPPVIAAAGFPLPERFSGVSAIYLLSAANAPLDVGFAMAILGKDEIIAGAPEQPTLRVWDSRNQIEELTADAISIQMATPSACVGMDLWVLLQLDKLVKAGEDSVAAKAVEGAKLPDVIRMSLLSSVLAKELSPRLAELLQASPAASSEQMLLGNGRIIKSGPANLLGVSKAGADVVLSNVGIRVTHKIRAYDGSEVLACSITPQSTDIAAIPVGFPMSMWGRPNLLREAVASAFAERGQSPYIAFYQVAGYDWYDILCKLSEHRGFSREVGSLGTDTAGDIHFPNFTVKASYRSLEPQRQVFTLPQHVMSAYGGIPGEQALSAREPFRRLLSRCNDPAVAAFVCGIMHVLYQVTFGLYKPKASRAQPGKHLLYVSSDECTWQAVFQQLTALFSSADDTPSLNYADPQNTLMEYLPLGTLPLIATVPAIGGDKLAKALGDTGIGLIGLVDETTAATVHGRTSAMFTVPPQDGIALPISEDELDALRVSFASFLLEYATNTKYTAKYRTSRTPAITAYEECCRILDIVDPHPLSTVLSHRFPVDSVVNGSMDMFFDLIHYMLVSSTGKGKKLKIANVRYAKCKDTSNLHVLILPQVAIVSYDIIELLNREAEYTFTVDSLTHELTTNNALVIPDTTPDTQGVVIDLERCWLLPRELWDGRVVRPAIKLPFEVTNGATAALSPLTK